MAVSHMQQLGEAALHQRCEQRQLKLSNLTIFNTALSTISAETIINYLYNRLMAYLGQQITSKSQKYY